MKNLARKICATAALAILFPLVNSVKAQQTGAAPLLNSYFDLLVSGNYESAGYLWTKEAQERSTKLGIKYQNIPLKMDCTSPIVQDLNLMKDYLQPPVKRYENLFDNKVQKLFYSAIVNGKNVEHVYFAEDDGRNFWLTYPQDVFAKDWTIKETEYFRLHIHPDLEEYCNAVMFDEADKFVARIGDSLGLKVYDLRHLQSAKIEFYFCKSDEQVEQITGFRTRGVYDKASSDIISSFFPHYHEVVHLLADYRLREAPLFVHPLFEEGLAVLYGGRWGKSTESLIPLGIFLYEQGIVSLDSMLDYIGFRNSAEADIAYPLAGLYNRFILERSGREKYLALYRKLSGTSAEMSALSVDSVKAYILGTVSIKSWDEMVRDFQDFMNKYKMTQYVALAGSSSQGEKLLTNPSAVVKNNGEWLEFEFVSDGSSAPKGNLLFGKISEPGGFTSAMFNEHYENKVPFDGYRYGVRYDTNEAGLYDYATNVLLAKFIAGVEPSENYYDELNHKISIRIKKSLTNGVLPAENDYKLLDH
jgi:hypothetical protein